MGGSVTDYGGLYRYLDAIEDSPRLRISTFGETFEHRELILLTISSPDNLARLEAIQRDTRRLADPRGLAADEAEAIVARTPAGVFLNYGNDGNESAAFEAALWMAWELLSGRHDALLEDLVVYVVPASNPDSHERFAAWFKATAPLAGRRPGPERRRAPRPVGPLHEQQPLPDQPEPGLGLEHPAREPRPGPALSRHPADGLRGPPRRDGLVHRPLDGRTPPHRAHRQPARLARGVRPGHGVRLRVGGFPLRAVGVRAVRPGLLGHPPELHRLHRFHPGDDRRRLAGAASGPARAAANTRCGTASNST